MFQLSYKDYIKKWQNVSDDSKSIDDFDIHNTPFNSAFFTIPEIVLDDITDYKIERKQDNAFSDNIFEEVKYNKWKKIIVNFRQG
jgi:hypothetical protein